MFLRRFFEPGLAQASYLIGCVKTREAIAIDANRDVDQYIAAAGAEGARITMVTETHIHADYVSGSRELAARTGARLVLSGHGGSDWRYGYGADEGARFVAHGDRLDIGNVRIDVVHTPGHTPEHLTFLVTDGAAADEPIGAVTGDFIFAGDVGRPDLLERAARVAGTMETAARQLWASLQAFKTRPDWLQLWPGHGAGSACGKGISAVPHTTLGYERRFNWAFQIEDEDEFVRAVLSGQPEPPKYFAEMKRVNRDGPPPLGGVRAPARLDLAALERQIAAGGLVVDTRPAAAFAVGHVPGTINIPLNGSFATWAGWLVPYDADFYLIAGDEAGADAGTGSRTGGRIATAVRELALIGLDRIGGVFDAGVVDAWSGAGRPLASVPQIGVEDLRSSLEHDAVTLVDVRGRVEWEHGHIEHARHIPLGYLGDRIGEVPRDKPVVVHCASGGRSSIAASLLRARGFDRVVNLAGGYNAWLTDTGAPRAMSRTGAAEASGQSRPGT